MVLHGLGSGSDLPGRARVCQVDVTLPCFERVKFSVSRLIQHVLSLLEKPGDEDTEVSTLRREIDIIALHLRVEADPKSNQGAFAVRGRVAA